METRRLDDFEIMRRESILKIKVIFYQESVPLDIHYVSPILANDSRRVSKHTLHAATYSLKYRCLPLDGKRGWREKEGEFLKIETYKTYLHIPSALEMFVILFTIKCTGNEIMDSINFFHQLLVSFF